MPKQNKSKGKKNKPQNNTTSKSKSKARSKNNDYKQDRFDEVSGGVNSAVWSPKLKSDGERYTSDSSRHRYHNDRDRMPAPPSTFRSAKISHRDGATAADIAMDTGNQSKLTISPAFKNSPLLCSHAHRSPSSLSSPSSILRSPSKSPSSSMSGLSTPRTPQSVSFGAVEVHEFKLTAGADGDGVPGEGAFSLHFEGAEEVGAATLDLDEYERRRYARWKRRAQKLHWSAQKLCEPEQYLWTAGRCDAFYSYLSPSEREKRVNIDKRWKREHSREIVCEREQLDELRASRKRNNIFCDCKPLSSMSTAELKARAREYGLKVCAHNKKVKRGYLLNQFTSKLGIDVHKCCWDATACSCIAAGIDCHCGTESRNFQCGCVAAHSKCSNRNGRYMYKEPKYSSRVINEWKRFYQDVADDNDDDDKMRGRRRIRATFKPIPFTL
mmetsp:Transcript_24512/g.39559  ORF Transcript_24512/g.39559 Transcript_24512/m.39559 type:complete len:440 (+) Transcript_24512:273-1592(+)